MVIKKILLILGITAILFTGVNTAAALNSSVLDAISGLPLSDQILFIAKEVDRLKLKDALRDACDSAEDLYIVPVDNPLHSHILNEPVDRQIEYYQSHLTNFRKGLDDRGYPYEGGSDQLSKLIGEYEQDLAYAEARWDAYLSAKADCDHLTEEFNLKYGN